MPTPTLRGVGPGNTGAGTSITVTLPTHAIGDLLICQLDFNGNNAVTLPSGWLLLREQLSGTALKQGLYYRVATTASTPNPAFGIGGTSRTYAANSMAWINADDITAVAVPSGGNQATSGTARSSSAAALIAPQPNMVHVVTVGALAGTNDAMTAPALFTEAYETDNGTVISTQMSYRTGIGPGSQAAVSTTGTASVRYTSQSFLLRSEDFATYRSHVKLTSASIATATFAANPAGAATNDILLVIMEKESTSAITAPAGWTALVDDADTAGGQTQHFYVAWKRFTAGDAAPSFTWTGAVWRSASLVAYYRCPIAGSPFDVQTALTKSASATALATASGTTSQTLTTLLGIHCNWNVGTTGASWTPDSSGIERVEGNNVYLQDECLVAAGATGTLSATADVAGKTVNVLLALLSTASAGGAATAYRDASVRLRASASGWDDATARLRLRAPGYRDAVARLRLAVQGTRDATTRLRLRATAVRDATTRVRLAVLGIKDAGLRLRVRAPAFRDAAVRLALRTTAHRDAGIRAGLGVLGYRDAATRLRLRATAYRDAGLRFRLTGPAYLDAAIRLALRAGAHRDATARLVLYVRAYRDAGLRLALRAQAFRDAALRVRLRATGYRDAVLRFGVSAPAGGLAASLAAYWKLDEASGNALDSHGANDLTDTNTVGAGTGKIAGARDFVPAAGEYFTRADNAALSTGDIDFTLQAWVRADDLSGTPSVIGRWGGEGQYEYLLYYDSAAGRWTFAVSTNGSSGSIVSVVANNAGAASTGTWYLVHAWHDAANDLLGISVNAGTADTVAHAGGVFDGTSNTTIGRNDGAAGLYWDGLLDEVAVWKRVLTSGERTQLHNGGAGLAYPFGATVAYRDVVARIRLQAIAYRDAGLRLRLRALAYRDAALRVALRAGAYRDATLRFRMQAGAYRDAAMRLRLSVLGYRDAALRLRLRALAYRDAALRLALRATAYRDAGVRLRASVLIYRDVAARLRLRGAGYRDAGLRFVLVVPGVAYRDAAIRLRLRAAAHRDAAVRLVLRATAYRDATLRFRLAAAAIRDATARARVAVGAWRDAATRLRIAAPGYRDAGLRLRLQSLGLAYRDAALRLRLRATAYRDAVARFALQVRGFRDAVTRTRIRVPGWRDAAARLRLRATAYRDATLRVRLDVRGYRDATGRLRLRALAFRDATGRVRVRALAYRDAVGRLVLVVGGARDAAVRLRTAAPGYADAGLRFNLVSGGYLGPDADLTMTRRARASMLMTRRARAALALARRARATLTMTGR